MFLGLIGLAIAFDNLGGHRWRFRLVIRYGVVAREEVYLERKFGDVYRYRARAALPVAPSDGSAPGGTPIGVRSRLT